ncbi:hypothetical protein M413DRAFT_445800 [Hebeloma cylindrosporum]|uniref:Secreted protein n=1 Tax=Hebeloma cylindrosporum TaxID=76867 RepID=A0A0C2XTS2_HEBCY|nr:hypothetical protein M413DRAFT_445800 [Hebeloma cylindrosporum h7]
MISTAAQNNWGPKVFFILFLPKVLTVIVARRKLDNDNGCAPCPPSTTNKVLNNQLRVHHISEPLYRRHPLFVRRNYVHTLHSQATVNALSRKPLLPITFKYAEALRKPVHVRVLFFLDFNYREGHTI